MPLYHYEALDRNGRPVVGTMQVPDETALQARLAAMGYCATTVEIARRPLRTAASARSSVPTARPVPVSPQVRRSGSTASERAVARMFHQLHNSVRAGMSLFQALTTVAEQGHRHGLRRALLEMAETVRDGGTLSAAMERYPRLFTPGDVGVVRAAEAGGFLPEALHLLADQHEWDDNTRRRLAIWTWFAHSNMLALLLFVAILPFFRAAIEAGFDTWAGLRAVGRMFLTVSLPLLVVYFGAIAGLGLARRSPAFLLRWHGFLLRLPVVGGIHRLRAQAVFARTLQRLYHAGIAGDTAWTIAAAAVPNRSLAAHLEACAAVAACTGSFSAAMQHAELFDAADAGMVAAAERAGTVEEALGILASTYEEDTRVALGSSVVRGAVWLTLWALFLGAVGFALFCRSYYGQLFDAVDRAFGLRE